MSAHLSTKKPQIFLSSQTYSISNICPFIFLQKNLKYSWAPKLTTFLTYVRSSFYKKKSEIFLSSQTYDISNICPFIFLQGNLKYCWVPKLMAFVPSSFCKYSEMWLASNLTIRKYLNDLLPETKQKLQSHGKFEFSFFFLPSVGRNRSDRHTRKFTRCPATPVLNPHISSSFLTHSAL